MGCSPVLSPQILLRDLLDPPLRFQIVAMTLCRDGGPPQPLAVSQARRVFSIEADLERCPGGAGLRCQRPVAGGLSGARNICSQNGNCNSLRNTTHEILPLQCLCLVESPSKRSSYLEMRNLKARLPRREMARAVLPLPGAFRPALGLIICRHFMMGFFAECAGYLNAAGAVRRCCS